MRPGLDWKRHGRDWPNRNASRFVQAGGLAWHVQVMGQGPVMLLLHGTAAATHSFRDLAPRLAERFTLIIPDLPGHGFSARPDRDGMTLPGMARSTGALLAALDVHPKFAVGHSAGAAILVRMALDGFLAVDRIVSLNGALLPFRGVTGQVAPGLARLLFNNPLTAHVVAFLAGQDAVSRTLAGMGSRIDRRGLALYTRLIRQTPHVEGALAMMAHWDLDALERDIGRLATPLMLVVGGQDRAVPPDVATAVGKRVPGAEIHVLRGVGHLAHEEKPDVVADLIVDLARVRTAADLTPEPAGPGSVARPTD